MKSVSWGVPTVARSHVRAYQDVGIEHLAFDSRTSFERYGECIEMVGTEVLPVLHRGDGRVQSRAS